MKTMPTLALAGGLLFTLCAATDAAAKPAAPAAMQGVVTQVVDGDTLRFTPVGQPALLVRLAQIDAPEPCQAWGPEARRALGELVLNKPASFRATGRDARGRTVGLLTVADADVGQRLVEEGHAWSLRTRNDHGPLVKQERMAKALGRGLHAGGTAVKPADFRRQQGACPETAGR